MGQLKENRPKILKEEEIFFKGNQKVYLNSTRLPPLSSRNAFFLVVILSLTAATLDRAVHTTKVHVAAGDGPAFGEGVAFPGLLGLEEHVVEEEKGGEEDGLLVGCGLRAVGEGVDVGVRDKLCECLLCVPWSLLDDLGKLAAACVLHVEGLVKAELGEPTEAAARPLDHCKLLLARPLEDLHLRDADASTARLLRRPHCVLVVDTHAVEQRRLLLAAASPRRAASCTLERLVHGHDVHAIGVLEVQLVRVVRLAEAPHAAVALFLHLHQLRPLHRVEHIVGVLLVETAADHVGEHLKLVDTLLDRKLLHTTNVLHKRGGRTLHGLPWGRLLHGVLRLLHVLHRHGRLWGRLCVRLRWAGWRLLRVDIGVHGGLVVLLRGGTAGDEGLLLTHDEMEGGGILLGGGDDKTQNPKNSLYFFSF